MAVGRASESATTTQAVLHKTKVCNCRRWDFTNRLPFHSSFSLRGGDVRTPLGRLPVLAGERGGVDGANPVPRLAPLCPGGDGGHAGY